MDDRRLRTLVRAGVVDKLGHNAYAVSELSIRAPETHGPDPGLRNGEHHRIGVTTRLKAAELALGRTVVACLDTAAELHGFDIRRDPGTHILAAQDWPSHRKGLVHHRPELLRPLPRVGGQDVTDPSETALRIAARERHGANSLAVLDAVVRHTGAAAADLVQLAGEMHIRGIRVVRELAPLAEAGAASPGESGTVRGTTP